jgi:hypothetical protein
MAILPRRFWITVLALGIVAFALGIVFIVNGFIIQGQIAGGLRAEQVTLGLSEEAVAVGDVVDTAGEAQAAQDILEEHLHQNYGTYGDTERGSEERTSYLDGTTLRNSLNLGVMGFGVCTMLLGTGAFILVTGIALGTTGLALRRRVS